MITHELRSEVERFLIREARLIDERRFEEWVALFSEDATYWMPGRTNAYRRSDVDASINEAGDLAIFEDTTATLRTRIARLRTGLAWGEEPPSRTRHLITNIDVDDDTDGIEFVVRSNFLVYRAQLELDKDIFVGERRDVLRRLDGALKIAKRTMILEDVVHAFKPVSIFF